MNEIRKSSNNRFTKNPVDNKRDFKYRSRKKFGSSYWDLDMHPVYIDEQDVERNTMKTTDDSDYEQRRVNSLLHVIFKICELSGFWVEDRIVLKDRKTGKIWR